MEQIATNLPALQTFVVAAVDSLTRAASDPGVDSEKMRQLWEVQHEMLKFSARAAYTRAFSAMQPEMPVVARNGQLKTRGRDGREAIASRYAKFEDINEAVKPILARHGFAIGFKTRNQAGQVCIVGTLSHSDGHAEESEITLPPDATGGKNSVQAVGSSLSYGKRYVLTALLNISVEGEDTDGVPPGVDPSTGEVQQRSQPRATSEAGGATEAQIRLLRVKMREAGMDETDFKAHFNIEHMADLPFDSVNNALAFVRDPQGAGG